MKSRYILLPLSVFVCLPLVAEPFDQKLYDTKARTYSPEESMAMIEMQPGYRLELVAAEPMVEEPAAIAWDGDSKLYVAELNTYMQDIDGKNQLDPVSRVVLLEDTDNDGKMDKRTVFADKLKLPRMIQPLGDVVIIRETDTFDLHSYRDTDGDGVADEKKLVYSGGPRGGNLEHQPSGLDWNIDNWMYVTYTNKRYRWVKDHIEAEDLPLGSGQWGVTHDDIGRNFFCTGGGENPAMDFQRPLVYGKISLPGEQEDGFREVFPLVAIPDVQGGGGRFRKDALTLNNFTGCAGQHIYRGDKLPADFYGDYIIPEPVGRLVRRAKVVNENGKIVVKNATPGTEFMRSRDANFRPVNAATGPDGCLYIVDMYRGIIQEGNWVGRGSYLRGVVENYGLDKNIGRGRIYRVVHESSKRDKKPQMLKAPAAELVKYLSHPNGWWRDEAQKLLVVRGDISVVAALQSLARNGQSPLGRLHALWTLDGLGQSDARLLTEKFSDADPRVRAAAIRISEPFLSAGSPALMKLLSALADDPDVEVTIQLILSLGRSAAPDADLLIEKIAETHGDNPNVMAIISSFRGNIAEAKRRRLQDKFLTIGETNFQAICSACHAPDGKGTPVPGIANMTLGAPLNGSPRVLGKKDIPIKVMLKGMIGELDGKVYPGPMLPLESYDDEWIAATLTYIRNTWGNSASIVTPQDVATVRSSIKDRKEMWQSKEILAMAPIPNQEMQKWTFTASHNPQGCKAAIDGNISSRWDTAATQQDGMWFSFDMGEPRKLTSIVLDATPSSDDYPRAYSVEISADNKSWKTVVAKTAGSTPVTDIILPGEPARYVRVSQHGESPGKYWSIHELGVYAD